MVIRPEHIEQPVESSLPLVQVVGNVRSDIRGLSVLPDKHPVFLVSEVSGTEPESAILLIGKPGLPRMSARILSSPVLRTRR